MSYAEELHVKTDDSYKPASVWYCTNCKIVHRYQEHAESCCREAVCTECGKPTLAKHYTLCPDHSLEERKKKDKEALEKATLVESWNGYIYSDDATGYNEGYFEDAGILIDYCEDEEIEVPEFAYIAEETKFQLNADHILENAADGDHHEDILDSLVDREELETYIEQWNAKQVACSYYPNYKKKVRVRPVEKEGA